MCIKKTLKVTVLLAAGLLFAGARAPLRAQAPPVARPLVTLASELRALYTPASLARYRSGSVVAEVSSYDTTGGNDDGFSGRYSYLEKTADGHLVVFDAEGSGVIERIWTPTPTEDTLDIYLDGASRPSLSIRFIDLFSGKVYPFVAPLCGHEVGGYYCYLPIPFRRGCRIVYRGEKMQFYQIQYRRCPEGAAVRTFSQPLSAEEKGALDKVASLWSRPLKATDMAGQAPLDTNTAATELMPGQRQDILRLQGGGRLLGIELTPADALAGAKDVDIMIRWDDESVPAVYCPLSDFFGFAFGQPSMQSLLLGSAAGRAYCFFPMPFDKKAVITLIRRKGEGAAASPLRLRTLVHYSRQPRDKAREGKFYTHWASRRDYGENEPHVFLHTRGRGHYVGTVLQAQGLNPGMTLFFEGDDSTVIDGQLRMHGTGSEDYFNGGWYALLDRWDARMSLPLHGALDYSLPLARTGGYRLFLSDKMSFDKEIYHSIEHGPEHNNMPAHYTSLALYYCDTPPAAAAAPTAGNTRLEHPETLMIYPQLMKFEAGGHVDFRFAGPLTMTADNGSLVRIALDRIPEGRYKLYLDMNRSPKGGSFSVWQRQSQRSDWVSAYGEKQEHVPEQYVCELEVRDFQRTLTLRFRSEGERRELQLNRLILKRITPADE